MKIIKIVAPPMDKTLTLKLHPELADLLRVETTDRSEVPPCACCMYAFNMDHCPEYAFHPCGSRTKASDAHVDYRRCFKAMPEPDAH